MALIRILLALALLAIGASLVGTAAFSYLHSPAETLPEGASVVVLSAGLTDNQMSARTAERAARGIVAYQALEARGETPLLVMSGGQGIGETTAHATLMGDAARNAGVPVSALRIEAASHSTLQNALYSRDILGAAAEGPLILVTSRYHLPRAAASFRWAGMRDLTLVAAEGPDDPPDIGGLLGEGIKWPGNALRAGIYSGASALGVGDSVLRPLLR